ncbi:2-dehydropantoate 2-reductase [Chryseobacterium sp. Y16C]|nr:2-dehydropantoate 2-reductase [Chryseobacterium sp. Y16C]UMQ40831.1 2-dehydropantoate 2-reductase [Chryseobacterium sp. Y16C]
MLAKNFKDKDNISMCFMARGENLKIIKDTGLKITTPERQFIAYPDIISDNPADFGKVDYIILCTKSYDIKETVSKIASCIKEETVFLPLLNGVDSANKIKTLYQNNLVAGGCAYIISRLVAPGHVRDYGHKPTITFGVQDCEDERLNLLYRLFKQSGIDATLTKDIAVKIWEKFVFISSTATITSYYNKTFGEIKQDEKACADLRHLIDECCAIADCKNIQLPANIKESVWDKFLNLLPDATTSMHSDYLSGKKETEVHSLTGYIVEQAKEYHLEVPTYQEMYHHLINR